MKELLEILDAISKEDNIIEVEKDSIVDMLKYLFLERCSDVLTLNRKFIASNCSITCLEAFFYKLCCNGILIKDVYGLYVLSNFTYEQIKNKCMECGKQLPLHSTEYYCIDCKQNTLQRNNTVK